MAFVVGRVDLGNVRIRWSESGNRLEVSGWTRISDRSKEALARIRQQLAGYVDSPDEAFVPVLWDEEPQTAGFYRVLAATVAGDGPAAYQGIGQWSVTLERVNGYAAPLVEVRNAGAARPIDGDVAGPVTFRQGHYFPASATTLALFEPRSLLWTDARPDVVRQTDDGAVACIQYSDVRPMHARYLVDPRRFYEGAATILMGQERLAPLVGRQAPATRLWRLSNGMLQLEPSDEDGFSLRMRMWKRVLGPDPDAGEWSPWVRFRIIEDGAGVAAAPTAVTILRNSPLEVGVRLSFPAFSAYPAYLDITLRRGQRLAEMYLDSAWGGGSGFLLSCPQLAGATVGPGGHYRFRTVVDVGRIVVTSPNATNLDGGDYSTGLGDGKRWPFAIGMVDQLPVDEDNQEAAVREYMWAGAQRMASVLP